MERNTVVFITIIVMLYLLPSGPDQPRSYKDRETLQQFKAGLVRSKRTLDNSTYASGYGNLTGFRLLYRDNLDGRNELQWPFREYSAAHPWRENEEHSILPNAVSDRVAQFWGKEPDSDRLFPLNILGTVYGEFEQRERQTPYALPLPAYLHEYYQYYTSAKYEEEKERYEQDPDANSPPAPDSSRRSGNVTYDGNMRVRFYPFEYNYMDRATRGRGERVEDAILVRLVLSLSDDAESDDNSVDLLGVYHQRTGALVAATRTAKFEGDCALPHLGMGEGAFNVLKTLVAQLLATRDVEREVNMALLNGVVQRLQQQCEYVAFLQFAPTEYSHDELREIDAEAARPRGLPLPPPPPLRVAHAVAYSPDCGVVLEKLRAGLEGLRVEVTTRQLQRVLTGFLALSALQLWLVVRQTKQARTPGQLLTVSGATVAMVGLQDLVVFVMAPLVFAVYEELYLVLSAVMVVTGVLCYVFELRLLTSILVAQLNERGTTWWEILRGSAPPLQPRERALDVANDVEEARYSHMLFVSGLAASVVVSFFVFNAMGWRRLLRRAFEYAVLLALNSFWVPQFFRNTLKNKPQALSGRFILGTSALKLAPLAYLALAPANPFRHRRDPTLVAAVAIWVFLQLMLLWLQEQLGPRFWIREAWLPEQYNYHPVLTAGDLESGFAADILANIRPGENGVAVSEFDCAICMAPLKVPVFAARDKRAEAMMLEFMVTPCHHIFHTSCLEDWLVYKLQCPVCRCALPPV